MNNLSPPHHDLPHLNEVVVSDALALMAQLPSDSIDMLLTDIPYGISHEDWDVLHSNTNSALGGMSPAQEQMGRQFKRRGKPINGWSSADKNISREFQSWCEGWAHEALRVLKPGASAIIFSGRRMMPRAVVALEDAGFNFRDMLAWEKPAALFRAQRLSIVFERRNLSAEAERWQGWRVGNLAPRYEPVGWFFKPYDITIADNVLEFGVGAMNLNAFESLTGSKANVIKIGMAPGEGGLHEAQKPVRLMAAFVALCTTEGQVVIDPFCGSGSTAVACRDLARNYVCGDADARYAEIATRRLDEEPRSEQGGQLSLGLAR